MSKTKDLTFMGVFVALLIGSQFAFSFISGVEIVTILFLTFAFCFGVKRGLIVATVFSILRCIIFGFYLSVIILYLVYYNLFALIVGGIGNKVERKYSVKNHIFLVVIAVLLTVVFTLLDDLITPLYYGFDLGAMKGYFYASLLTLIPQLICSLGTVSLLFLPLYKAINKIKGNSPLENT